MNLIASTACVLISFLVTMASGAKAFQANPSDDVADRRLQHLLDAHKSSNLGYRQSYEEFRPKFEQLAKEIRGTEAEVRAALWLIQQSWWLREEGRMSTNAYALAKDLVDRHADSTQLGLLVEYQYVFSAKQKREIFEALLRESPHRRVQAAAHLGLARQERARDANGAPNEHFRALLDSYGDEQWRHTNFGSIANAYLNPHAAESLSIGKPAPEIEGVDNEGNPMKLSDYRGKVVLLDFWGDW